VFGYRAEELAPYCDFAGLVTNQEGVKNEETTHLWIHLCRCSPGASLPRLQRLTLVAN
jgi:hypothetical protein